MKVANIGMKWFLGFTSLMALAGTAQAAQYPLYSVVRIDDSYCSITYQKSEKAKVEGVPLKELKKLGKLKHYQSLVRGYQPSAEDEVYRTGCREARALARGLKNAILPRSERLGEQVACRANNKVYRVHVHDGKASMHVTKVTGETIFFGPTESESGGEIQLKIKRHSEPCSVQFTHSSEALEGFNLCLAEGEKVGTLHVNRKNVVVTCNPTDDFREAVAEALDSEKHPHKKSRQHAALGRHHHARSSGGHKKPARHQDENFQIEVDTTAEVDPDVDFVRSRGASAAPSAAQ